MGIVTLGTGAGVIYQAGKNSVTPTSAGVGSGAYIVENVSNPSAINEGRCIVAVSGNQYDVTSLAQTHGGPRGISTVGGFFKCGTDMSLEYAKEHGNNLSKMAPYLITGTDTNAGITTISKANIDKNDDNESEEWDD